MPHFQIPNARVGQPYQARIRMHDRCSTEIFVLADSVQLAADLGLSFDADSQYLQGTPTQAGDFKLQFQYKTNVYSEDIFSAEVGFFISPDPRSLWQINEPDGDQPYPKQHAACAFLQTPEFNIAASSQRGRSHEHTGCFRDDDFFIQHVANSDWAVLVVADGAGSAKFSRQGAQLAVQNMGQVLSDYVQQQHSALDQALAQWQISADEQHKQALTQQLYHSFHEVFYQAAIQSIEEIEVEAAQHQLSAKAFATTLLAAVVKQHGQFTFVCSFWVGDGAIAIYGTDRVRLMGSPDAGEFAGQTRFLDRSILQHFSRRVNMGYFENRHAVILMTDGISDPLFETDAGLLNSQKWHHLWQQLLPQLAVQQPAEALLQWSKFFSTGHHDDRSLIVLWRKMGVEHQYDTSNPSLDQATDQVIVPATHN